MQNEIALTLLCFLHLRKLWFSVSRATLISHQPFKDNVRIYEHRIFYISYKNQTSVCFSISLNPCIWYFKLGIWNHGKKKKKGKQFYC